MSLSAPFIRRPVGTTLLTAAVALAGVLGFLSLPVSPLPQVEFPTISVSAGLPGASPETMASAVATPLERQFGRIAGITEMTSTSYLGTTSITMQFDLNRNIDAAARDVQAAINAARGNLPANLPSNPTYRKVNPADAPIMILSITSDNYDKSHMYDAASSILAQKLSQVKGVGQVSVGGGALPAVRVDVNPAAINVLGLGMEDVRTMLGNANTNRPKGSLSNEEKTVSLHTTDQLFKASEYRPLIIAFRNGAPITLEQIATVSDSVEDIRASGLYNGNPSISLIVFRQPGANIIDAVDRVREMIPQLQAEIPAAMKISVAMDRSITIRASVHDVEITLLLSIVLVILVVFMFLRNVRATLIPSVAVPISLIGTFGVMYLCGYSIDNLSLMALTIATGFVVDDAIVVVENITRYLEQGMTPLQAAFRGAREIGFTVLSMSVSLVAVFIPILLMSGIVGRLFREFAVVLSVAIGVSLIISLTTTPMMCALLLRPPGEERHGRIYRASEAIFNWVLKQYEIMLGWVLRHQFTMLIVTLLTVGLTIWLYAFVPKGFFPQQDTGRLTGTIKADQNTSFQAMDSILTKITKTVSADPDVDNVIAFTGGQGGRGGSTNTAQMFVALKTVNGKTASADAVMARLRRQLGPTPGATLILQSVQDFRIGGRGSSAQFQYTLQGDNVKDLTEWTSQMLQRMKEIPGVVDLDTDQQDKGLQASLVIDRDTASRLGITAQAIDNTLYDAFGQRQVSTMYTALNQYHVVMEADPRLWQNPDGLKSIYVTGTNGAQVPLSAIAHYSPSTHALAIPHSGQFPSTTISFNLVAGKSLGDAVGEIEQAAAEIGLPENIHGSFSGTAQAYQSLQQSEVWLVLAALVTVYIVLGILYESYIHPITILSTLPSAGVGALVALWLTGTDLSMIALIGIILLIGIVKKNAILMIDFALDTERKNSTKPEEAIFQACLLRFRPIMMTTMAALLGGLPLALGAGSGAELRQPLGISIVGGLIFSQALTLFTTPVVYLYLDRMRLRWERAWHGQTPPPFARVVPGPA
ncbi:MAG TPA: multidrug efflux RND transporter permease subunit [Humisphaera sp.]|jgi:multidrug efflux pump|nr:multidrug efflux RND transporter permease subunit [Humisphaera sp.]